MPYCTSLSIKTGVVGESTVSEVDEHVATIPYLQDLTADINGIRSSARTCWDNGSNRVLVNNEVAEENHIIQKPVIMKTAWGNTQKLDVNLFELGLVDRSGTVYKIWGNGVNTILDPDEPVDPACVRDLFHHVPAEVFEKLKKRRLDLLIGINYNGLFPSGGFGCDCQDNLRVIRTKFSKSGWILEGSHPQLKWPDLNLSSSASRILTSARLHCTPEVVVRDADRSVSVCRLSVDPKLTTDYWDKDNLSILPPRRCTKCRL